MERMRQIAPALAALAMLTAAQPAAAQSAEGKAFLSVCGDRRASAAEVVRTCRLALREGSLDRAQRAGAALNLGAALMELDQPEQAIAAYGEALDAQPNGALALSGRAEARVAAGDLAGAAQDWRAAVASAPADGRILTSHGAFLLRTGDPAGALAAFEAALMRDPRARDARFNRGLALAELGRDGEAIAAFTAIILRDPEDLGAWMNRGRLRAASSPEAALTDFNRAVALAGDWSQALVERGALLDAMGRRAEADADFRRAWELGHRSEALNARIVAMGQRP